ncbi:G-protein coupled receptor 83-like [Montipora capricornis]|uniref:G-protein coupled receptor 83-like n=1 Tax=Montipora capricornis TaxID=246305 RepID=UPI0035F1BD07
MTASTSNVVKTSILGNVTLFAILGNVIVAYVLMKNRKILLRRRPTYQFILNLTISDLVICVLFCPFEMVREALDSWIFGAALCKIIEFVEISTSGTTVMTHALIAIDRYRSLAHPFLPKLRPTLVKQMIAFSWLFPSFIAVPYLYMAEVVDVDHKPTCTPLAIPVLWLDNIFEAVVFALMFFLPLCVICWCYYHVLSITLGNTSNAQVVPPAEIALRRSQKRVTRTACLITVAFIICWTPTFVLSIRRIVLGTESVYHGDLLFEISFLGGLVNEATNPILYTAYDRNMNVSQYIRCINRVSIDGGALTGPLDRPNEAPYSANERFRQSCRKTTNPLRVTESQPQIS